MRRLAALALCAAAVPVPASAAPATVEVVFAASDVTQSCGVTYCTVSGVALVCQSTDLTSAGIPTSGPCRAHVSLTFARTVTDRVVTCTDGWGELTFSDKTRSETVGVRAANGTGAAAWHSVPSPGTSIVAAQGVLAPACTEANVGRGLFTGSLELTA